MHRNDRFAKQGSSDAKPRRSPGTLTCSTCGRPFHIDETPTPPFCSERCQLVDLGRWLDEDIGVPHEGGNSDSAGAERDDGDIWGDGEAEDGERNDASHG